MARRARRRARGCTPTPAPGLGGHPHRDGRHVAACVGAPSPATVRACARRDQQRHGPRDSARLWEGDEPGRDHPQRGLVLPPRWRCRRVLFAPPESSHLGNRAGAGLPQKGFRPRPFRHPSDALTMCRAMTSDASRPDAATLIPKCVPTPPSGCSSPADGRRTRPASRLRTYGPTTRCPRRTDAGSTSCAFAATAPTTTCLRRTERLLLVASERAPARRAAEAQAAVRVGVRAGPRAGRS